LNSNTAVVTRLLNGGQRVELRLPKGGRTQAQNRGFDVGEIVCFTLDATGRRIVQILPKDVADLKVAIAQDPMLSAALQDYDDDTITDDYTGFGQEDEGDPHQGGDSHREWMEIWGHNEFDPLDYEDRDGADDHSEDNADPSGETAPDEIYLLSESGDIPELVEDYDPYA